MKRALTLAALIISSLTISVAAEAKLEPGTGGDDAGSDGDLLF